MPIAALDAVAPRPRNNGCLLAGLLLALMLAGMPSPVRAQGAAPAAGVVFVQRIELEVLGAGETQDARRREAEFRRLLGIFPGRRYSDADVEFGLSRLRAAPDVAGVSANYAPAEGEGIVLMVRIDQRPVAAAAPEDFADRVRLLDDGERLFKLRLGLKGAIAVSGNQWFDNGATLTRFNPRGRFTGGNGPNGVLDLAPSIGFAGAVPLGEGRDAPYLYGSALYLGAGSVGQDNNRNDARFASHWEEAYAGIVMAGTTEVGSVWRANLSFGRQPYCIGNGMLICQIASSGGDRAADFAWPRWTGFGFAKAQLRWNQTLFEAFRFEPNDFPSTGTRLAGVNVDHDSGRGFTAGLTFLRALEGRLKYYFPDGRSQDRKGLKVLHLRAAGRPVGPESGAIWKAEWARQTHSDFDMRATGYSLEAGWQFAGVRGRPSVSYRYSSTTGDDPATARYERWDLLYSGNDIDTWVQGQLMKNIHYNSNVAVHRVLLRATPWPKWRLTGAASVYRADTLNNVGGVISQLAGRSLGTELLVAAEHYLSRHVYWRFTAAALWPGSGVRGSLPESVSQPWLVGIAQFNISY